MTTFQEINSFVQEYGTGVIRVGPGKYDIVNKTITSRLTSYLLDVQNAFYYMKDIYDIQINVSKDRRDSVFCDCIEIAAGEYDPERGASFVTYFRKIFQNALKNVHEPITESLYYDDDNNGDDQDDGQKIGENGYFHTDDLTLHQTESMQRIFDMLYSIMQVVISKSRTKGEIFRLFYTDTIINAFSKFEDAFQIEFRHEKQIFDNLEKGLVWFVYSSIISSLRDMSEDKLKTNGQLMNFYSYLDENKEDVEKEYLSVWGIKEKEAPEKKIKLPFSNAVFLAYLFIKEYEMSDMTVIPKAHKDGYISNYSKSYKEMLEPFKQYIMM